MTIPGRRHWALWHMERGLRRSDPHLAAMLAIFVRLTVGEAITSPGQRMTARRWIGRALAGLGRVLIAAAAGVSARARRAIRRIGLAGDAGEQPGHVVADVTGMHLADGGDNQPGGTGGPTEGAR